jgi:hypothetical protein
MRSKITLLASGLALIMVTAVAQAGPIGKARSVKPEASGSVGGILAPGKDVHENENIRTGDTGQAGLQFHDSSKLDVGPKSSVKLDRYIYNPNTGKKEMIINAVKGGFRFGTGTQGSGAVKVKTPYGTLGIRG